MSDTTKIDLSQIKFTSTAFPTDEDMNRWNSLSPEEQRSAIIRDIDAAEASGVAPAESMADRLKRVRSAPAHGL